MARTLGSGRWRSLMLAAGAATTAAIVVGAGTAVAATPSTPAAAVKAHPAVVHHRARRSRRFIGVVTNDTATGGVFNMGQLTIETPDGTTLVLNLSNTSHAYMYSGPGHKWTAENPTSIPNGEVVAVNAIKVEKGASVTSAQFFARGILETGFVSSAPAAS